MALINIRAGFVGGRGGENTNAPIFRASGASQTLTSAATSTQSSVVGGVPEFGTDAAAAVRIYTDTAIWVEIGENPIAVDGTSTYIPAGGTEYFYISGGQKIAVLEDS